MRAELIRVRMYALGQLVLEPLSGDFAPLAAAWDTFLADAVDTGSVVVRSTGASSSAAASASASSGLAPAGSSVVIPPALTGVTEPTGACGRADGAGAVVQASTGSMLRATQAFQPAYAPPRTAVSRNSLRTRCLLRRGGPTSPLRAASAAVPRVAASLRAGSLAASALTTALATAGSTSLFTFSTAGSTFGPAQSRAVVTLGAAQSTAVSTLGAAQSRVASARLFARRAVERDFFCRVVMGDTGNLRSSDQCLATAQRPPPETAGPPGPPGWPTYARGGRAR